MSFICALCVGQKIIKIFLKSIFRAYTEKRQQKLKIVSLQNVMSKNI